MEDEYEKRLLLHMKVSLDMQMYYLRAGESVTANERLIAYYALRQCLEMYREFKRQEAEK